ncbi:mitochondrial fission 1 protein [Russula compacta]|nr:mitochondrial fission 1 protein [Russula compacta]
MKKTAEVPHAADAEVSLSSDELQLLRSQYEKEVAQTHVTTQTKFNYARGLVKSPVRECQVEGVRLLTDIYCLESTIRRECLYYLALGHYNMGNFDEAKSFNSCLLEREPTDSQAQSLATLIDKAAKRAGCKKSFSISHTGLQKQWSCPTSRLPDEE